MNRSWLGGLFFAGTFCLIPACENAHDPSVANVGGVSVPLSEVQSRLNQTPEAYQHYATTAEGRREFLNLLIREKVLLVEARKAGLARDDAYRQAVRRFETEWKRRLQDYEDSLLVDAYLRRLRSKDLAVTDADVEHFYNDHRADYAHPVELQTSHILVDSEADAQKALDRLKNGEPFDRVAREMSKDPATAAHGGVMAPFRRGTLVPEFEAAAFALKNGETSGIVKTQFGFHIIKKMGQKQLPPQSLEEAREDIRARLEREKFSHWVSAHETRLGVSINEKVLSLLSAPPPSSQE